jgi:hypothetical protein
MSADRAFASCTRTRMFGRPAPLQRPRRGRAPLRFLTCKSSAARMRAT